jgi:DNA integrity scanning protein DisA with diadenylate cyclase activity
MNQILASFQNIQVRDVIDILLVAAVFYGIFRFLRETRAQQLFRGIVLIFIFNGIVSRAPHRKYRRFLPIPSTGF